jgi:uncharacterized protein (DUF1697 family)
VADPHTLASRMPAKTETYAALMRGINVGGRSTVKMDDLRRLFTDLGFDGVTSYLQSGNVVFGTDRASRSDTKRICESIEQKIRAELGLDVTVLLRSASELGVVRRNNPFVDRTSNLATLHVTFLADAPAAKLVASLPGGHSSEEFSVARREIYLFCPDGYGRSKLTNTVFERRLSTRATTRNWKTVLALADMTS